MRTHLPTPVVIAGLVLLAAAGCTNPFKPARPERPTQGVFVLENYSDPESVLVTIGRSYAAQSDGATAYANALASTFVATHDPEVVRRARDRGVEPPAVWNLQLERTAFQYLVALRGEPYDVEFYTDNDLDPDEIGAGGRSMLLHRKYTVFTRDPNRDFAVFDTLALGIVDLTMVLDGTRWSVSQWQDRILPAITESDIARNPDLESMGARRLESR